MRLLVGLLALLTLCGGLTWLAGVEAGGTFLLLGVDQRPDEVGPTRTDVILLAHGDGAGPAVLLSVPRDLWLPQPNGVSNRVNTAALAGDTPGDPHAGPRYLGRTLSDAFGLPINAYFLINFDGFVRIVDAAGGVEVNVPSLIIDENYPTPDYGVQTIRFDPGPQLLSGERALMYVRTRHQDSDFGRAVRQQQVVRGLATRLLRPQHWWRLPAVGMAAARAIQSDLAPTQAPALVALGLRMALGTPQRWVLNESYVTPWITETGAYVLLPQWEAIRAEQARLSLPGSGVE